MSPGICENPSTGDLYADTTGCYDRDINFRGSGANLFDLFWCSSTGMETKACAFNQSLAMLQSYKATGLRFFRFFASDWGKAVGLELSRSLAAFSPA